MALFSAITRQRKTPLPALLVSAPALVFLGAFMLRAAVAVWMPDAIVWPDGERYEKVAINLLEGKGFGSLEDNRLSVPTQPLLIAAVYSVFGQNYLALRIFFAVVGAATCVLGCVLTKRLFGANAAIIAGVLLAVYPYFIYLSALFEYPQTFFIFVMALFFLLLFRFTESNRKSTLFLSGLALGVGVLSVPTVLIFAPFVFLHLLSRPFAEMRTRALILLVAVAIPVGSWSIRNYFAYDKFILVNAAAGENFWFGNNETYYRYGREAITPPCERGNEDTVFCKQYRALLETERSRGLTGNQAILVHEAASWNNGLQFIRESPTAFALLVVKKFLRLWSPIPDAVHRGGAHVGAVRDVISIASYIPVLILALWGAVLTIDRWRRLVPIYTYFLALTATYCVFMPTTRYRLPLDFFLIVFAAVALAYWWERMTRPDRGRLPGREGEASVNIRPVTRLR